MGMEDESVAELIARLRNVDLVVAAEAVEELGGRGAREAIPDLLDLLRDEATRERNIQDFQDPYGWYEETPRLRAMEALASMRVREATPRIEELMGEGNGDPNERGAAILALKKLGADRLQARIEPMLLDRSWPVREAAVSYLGAFPGPGTLEWVEHLLASPDAGIRRDAATLHALLRGGERIVTCPACKAAVLPERTLHREPARRTAHGAQWRHVLGCGGCLTIVQVDRPEGSLEPPHTEILFPSSGVARALERLRRVEGDDRRAEVAALRDSPDGCWVLRMPEAVTALREWFGSRVRLVRDGQVELFGEGPLAKAFCYCAVVPAGAIEYSAFPRTLRPVAAGTVFDVKGTHQGRLILDTTERLFPDVSYESFDGYVSRAELLEPADSTP